MPQTNFRPTPAKLPKHIYCASRITIFVKIQKCADLFIDFLFTFESGAPHVKEEHLRRGRTFGGGGNRYPRTRASTPYPYCTVEHVIEHAVP